MDKIYKKGRRKEYALCDDLRQQGYDIVQRTAGSHSPIDIIAIHRFTKKILFIQSKRVLSKQMSDIDDVEKNKIESEMSWLNDKFSVEFRVE